MRKRAARAFTLIEMVILLFLAGVILFAVSRLTRETYKSLVFLREKAQTYESAVLGVERLTSDMREAVTTPVTSGSSVSFSKVKPAEDSAKGGAPRPNPLDPAYATYAPPTGPYGGGQLVTVTYNVTGGNLQRQIAGFTSVVAEDVNDFSVTARGNGSFEVVLSIQENRRVQTFHSFRHMPGSRSVRPFFHHKRGSLLISALLLFAILLTLGLGIMSSQAARMKAAQAQVASLQAKQLALAGWEDFRVKLGKDFLLIQMVEDQTYLSYSEDVYIPDPGGPSEDTFYGTYTVVCDTSRVIFEPEPVGIYVVSISGKVGPRNEQPVAERQMEFEINAQDNRVIRIYDEGSL